MGAEREGNEMEQQTIGKRIMQLRKEKGLTQEQLAERMGVSAQAVSKWENDVSCPDISILPQLAAVLGTTTDELLGAKPLEPHVVVVGSKNQAKDDDGRVTVEFNGKGFRAFNGIGLAVILIVLGGTFLLDKAGVLPIGIWGIVWPCVLMGLGIAWLIEDLSVFGLGMGLLGLYFLLFHLGAITFVLTWSYIWPSLIVLLGLSILIHRLNPKRRFRFRRFRNREGGNTYSEANDFLQADCSFTEEKRKYAPETLTGGDIDLSFGQGTFDLTNVQRVTPGAKFNVDVSFGECIIILPRRIRLELRADKSFGSIQMRGEAASDARETLVLEGDVSFGELSIRYV